MAKTPGPPAASTVTSLADGPPPPPNLAALASWFSWPKGRPIHRIHLDRYDGNQFNPGVSGNARFSPIKTKAGLSIPTLYGGMTFECAAMETVFHDVPYSPGLKTLEKSKLRDQTYSQLIPGRDLNLIDLSSPALRKLGIERKELIDTEKDRYPHTRKWAEAFHAECDEADGLCWVSRQDDRASAIMLFGDRVEDALLAVSGPSQNILSDLSIYGDLLVLADRIGLDIVARL